MIDYIHKIVYCNQPGRKLSSLERSDGELAGIGEHVLPGQKKNYFLFFISL